MQEAVIDAIVQESTDDPVLKRLIEITVASVKDNMPLFDVLHEPVLYRELKRWVTAGLYQVQKAKDMIEEATKIKP